MRKRFYKLLALTIGALIPLTAAYASDYYDASGVPAARSLLSSADMRAEFLSIQTGISDKLPALTGNGGSIVAINSGGTALEALTGGVTVAQGGTGAATESGARTSLGLAIGSDVQAWDTDLDTLAALAKSDSNFIVGNGAAWVAENSATARTSLGVGTADSPQFTAVNIGHADDTTITRVSAGVIEVEGETVPTETSGTFTVSYSDACTTTPSHDWNWVKHGNMVVVTADALSGSCTSNSSLFQDTTPPVPSNLWPTNTVSINVMVHDNGTNEMGCVRIFSTGDVDFKRFGTSVGCGDAFTASGTKHATIGSFSYRIDN